MGTLCENKIEKKSGISNRESRQRHPKIDKLDFFQGGGHRCIKTPTAKGYTRNLAKPRVCLWHIWPKPLPDIMCSSTEIGASGE